MQKQIFTWWFTVFYVILSIPLSAEARFNHEDYLIHANVNPNLRPRLRRAVNDPGGIIPPYYDINALPPTPTGKPVAVSISALVMDVRDVDEMKESISMELKLKVFWYDTRLINITGHLTGNERETDFEILNLDTIHKIWHPDIYIEHVKNIEHPGILSKPASLRIYADGKLRYSTRMTVSVACQMDFKYYPVDTQKCVIDIQSYAYHEQYLTVRLGEEDVQILNTGVEKASLSNFDLTMGPSSEFLFPASNGNYTGISFSLILRRDPSYHLIQTYLPSIIYMFVSWLSFILPLESASERMGYCMTCLFTLTSMFSAVRQSTPNVSYVKALDVWMVACIFFVFLTLLQHALISKVRRRKIRVQPTQSSENGPSIPTGSNTRANNGSDNSSNPNEMETSFITKPEEGASDATNTLTRRHVLPPKYAQLSTTVNEVKSDAETKPHWTIYHRIAKKANKYLSLIIPILFLLFNLMYWSFLIYIKIES